MNDPKKQGRKHAEWLIGGLQCSIYTSLEHAIHENEKIIEIYKANGTNAEYIIFTQAIVDRLKKELETQNLDK